MSRSSIAPDDVLVSKANRLIRVVKGFRLIVVYECLMFGVLQYSFPTCLKAFPSSLPAFFAIFSMALAFAALLRTFTRHDTKHTSSSTTSKASREITAKKTLGSLYAERPRKKDEKFSISNTNKTLLLFFSPQAFHFQTISLSLQISTQNHTHQNMCTSATYI